MKGQAKKKGIYKKEASPDPASQEKEKKTKSKGNSLPQSLYIGSAYKRKKEKGLPFI